MTHVVSIRDGQSACAEKGLSNLPVAFLSSGGGVVKSGDYLVQAQSTPDNTVKVAAGRAYVPTPDGTMVYATYLDVPANVTIGPNNSGNPRIDSIVLYIDLAASPDASASNVAKFYDVQGTPAGSPSPPSNAEILAAIGSSNPYIVLADIAVANGFTSINSGNITDQRDFVTLSGAGDVVFQSEFPNFISSGLIIPTSGTLTTSCSAGILYYDGNKVEVAGDGGHTYAANKDTYVDVSNAGVYTYNEVANEAAAPALTSNSLRIAKVVTNASAVTTVVQTGTDSNGVSIYPSTPIPASGIATNGWVAAGETWVYVSADDPTYVFKIVGVDLTSKYYPGMRVKLTQTTGGTKFFIITKVGFTTDTTITVYGGTDYDLANETISSPYYSAVKAPAGFPLDPTKWQIKVTNTSNVSQASPTVNTWYNVGSLSITVPIGAWKLVWQAAISGFKSGTTGFAVYGTLSTANNSASDPDLVQVQYTSGPSGDYNIFTTKYSAKKVLLASKTVFYLNEQSDSSGLANLGVRGDLAETLLLAECAYL